MGQLSRVILGVRFDFASAIAIKPKNFRFLYADCNTRYPMRNVSLQRPVVLKGI